MSALKPGHRVTLGESRVLGTVKTVTPKRVDVEWDTAPLKSISPRRAGQRILYSYQPEQLTHQPAIGDLDRYDLPDGSTMAVEWFRGSAGVPSALIWRTVGEEVVWGQTFGGDRVLDSVKDCLVKMRANPSSFLSPNHRSA